MKRLLAIILTVVCTIPFVSCASNNNIPPVTEEKSNVIIEEVISPSNNAILTAGRTDYTIVYPQNADPNEYTLFAVQEFQALFYEATGATMSVTTDEGVAWTENEKIISIGDTACLNTAEVKKDIGKQNFDYGFSGYSIVTKGKSLFIFGGQYGELNGVYEFMTYQFNYDIFCQDEILIDKVVGDCKINNYKVTKMPSIDANQIGYGEVSQNKNYARKMRAQVTSEVWLPKNGTAFHTFMSIFPESEFKATHPEWFSNGQLCLSQFKYTCPCGKETLTHLGPADFACECGTAGSAITTYDIVSNSEMEDVLVEKWLKYIEQGDATHFAMTFTPMDTGVWSNAASSMEMYHKYGSNHSAEYIQFINGAAKKLNAQIEALYPNRQFFYCIFAYQTVTTPPVGEDANGNYYPLDEKFKFEKNVQLFYAPIRASFYHPLSHAENQMYDDLYKKWSVLAPNKDSFYWLYGANFEDSLLPLDVGNAIPANYKYVADTDGKIMFYQTNGSAVASDWSRLNIYLMSKLGQDAYADVSALTDKFFTHYFKDAAPAMRKFYNAYKAHFSKLDEETNLTFTYVSEGQIAQRENWEFGMLEQWQGYIDEAMSAIEYLKTSDSTTYKKLKDRITIEGLTIRYVKLKNYSIRLDNSKLFAQQLLDDCLNLNVNEGSYGVSIKDHLASYL